MIKIKAKFRCIEVHDRGHHKKVDLKVVTSDSEENKSFANYTPEGEMTITVNEDTAAYNFFQPTQEYVLTIEKAEAQE